MQDETKYKLLKLIESDTQLSQREIAKQMGVSLGKINYCLKALVDKGFVKFQNFFNNTNKSAYSYILTPKGIDEKAKVTYRFLQRKLDEYENIKVEIALLKIEAAMSNDSGEIDSEF